MRELHGIVLAGGISNRMGYAKAFAPIGDRFFLQAVYEQLIWADAAPVHLVLNPGLLITLGDRKQLFPQGVFLSNPEPSLGQIHSLKLGLRSAQENGAGAALLALVDLPAVQPATFQQVAARAAAAPDRLIIPRHGGKRGHPILIPAPLFNSFLNAAPGETGQDVVHSLMDRVEYVDVVDPAILHDVDSPADLKPPS